MPDMADTVAATAATMVRDCAGVSALPLASRNAARHRSSRKRVLDEVDKLALLELGMPASRASASRGPFWFEAPHTAIVDKHHIHRGITRKESLQLDALLGKGLITPEFLDTVLVPLNDETSEVPRLRAYNWCVTNFAKGNPVVTLKSEGGACSMVDPAVSYAQLLKSMHRTLFDPYRRGTLLFFQSAATGATEYTTVGQLTFVCWCIENGVDTYVAKHEEAIRAHMNAALRGKRALGSEGAAQKRTRIRELTSAPSKYFRGAVASNISYSAGSSK